LGFPSTKVNGDPSFTWKEELRCTRRRGEDCRDDTCAGHGGTRTRVTSISGWRLETTLDVWIALAKALSGAACADARFDELSHGGGSASRPGKTAISPAFVNLVRSSQRFDERYPFSPNTDI